MPWDPRHRHSRKPIGADQMWRYRVQSGIYHTGRLARLLTRTLQGEDDEDLGGIAPMEARLFDLDFDEGGSPLPDTFALALNAWASGMVLRHGIDALRDGTSCAIAGLPSPDPDTPGPMSGYPGFDALSRHLLQALKEQAATLVERDAQGHVRVGDDGQPVPRPADKQWLDAFTRLVVRRCGLPSDLFGISPAAIVIGYRIPRQPRTPDDTDFEPADSLINSCFIPDLRHLSELARQDRDGERLGLPLHRYLRGGPLSQPVDIRSRAGLEKARTLLEPDRFPQGAWPSDHPLVYSQQLAVNAIRDRLLQGTGLFAVNGPPGTGKTTLLRDLVAMVVTERAKVLAALDDPREGFGAAERVPFTDGVEMAYRPLRESLAGFSILVASANNGAVENISLELPRQTAVPEPVLARSDYFRAIAALLGHRKRNPGPVWGLLSAALGNKANRLSFVQNFYWKKPADEHGGPVPERLTDGEGMGYHLRQIEDGKRLPFLSWRDAVLRFEAALRAEAAFREALVHATRLPRLLDTAEARLKAIAATRARAADLRERLAESRRRSSEAIADAERRLEALERARPGWLKIIVTLGQARETYRQARARIEAELRALKAEDPALANHWAELRRLEDAYRRLVAEQARLAGPLSAARDRHNHWLRQLGPSHGAVWPGLDDETRERSAPWYLEDWHRARQEVFLAALDLHRAFVENNAAIFRRNLGVVCAWLTGRRFGATIDAALLDHLCLVVPVVSSTFASVGRMLDQVGPGRVGWLLIDEAGQAAPQQAVGAIHRARRVVVVGDPLQLEPVAAIPRKLEEALAERMAVDDLYRPGRSSAQVLADRATDLGTAIPRAGDGAIWVGCPLRVHRRCDEPMFSISNTIAYGGLMVYGKVSAGDAVPLPASCWIDVNGTEAEDHWIHEEGRALRDLLGVLKQAGADFRKIFLISPFRSVARRLKDMDRGLGLDRTKVGTVHTAQGKQAEIVIVVLGGHPRRPGAKDWAAERPNLLNVAVSRAERRLYLIGNRTEWGRRRFFDQAARMLPARRVQELVEELSLWEGPSAPTAAVDAL
ncbi:DEAD/DEAH box helicase [Candidatus Methylocalor cossyra]|uniref:Viral (Super1) RNA helicase n=1 Tax=Candidatus Methylocalor cossyra TaxID=3108543 RepID=A0ABM9NFQ9_9GAMM